MKVEHWMLPVVAATLLVTPRPALADPCGMVPPIWVGQGSPIRRVGKQKTYVFFKDGIETIALNPGFSGNVDNFGMLIPFPSVPAMRKVDDKLMAQIAAAVEPPEVVLDLSPPPPMEFSRSRSSVPSAAGMADTKLEFDEVRVLKQEAIGMYQIAVLAAGSAKALGRWMDEHGYQFPDGMEGPANAYVALGWVFVAVKTRVGNKAASDPKPGMRKVNPGLPSGATFSGNVQAMGFRFKVDRPVVPMRLSVFNEGEPHNIVYVLMKNPVRIDGIQKEYVKRQISGALLRRNVTGPLPLRIIGGKRSDITVPMAKELKSRRDPAPHNAIARALFASDLHAVATGKLALDFEEDEKALLNIGEALGLRGTAIDTLNHAAVEKQQEKALGRALNEVDGMHMTVVDGLFDKQFLAESDLTFSRFKMPTKLNHRDHYDAVVGRGNPRGRGILVRGPVTGKGTGLSPKYYRIY